jgi:hypothetical protein
MPQMANITYTAAEQTVTWASVSPAGAVEPARWQTNLLDAASKVGYAKLSSRVRRNAADTADHLQINIAIPQVCQPSSGCPEQVANKMVMQLNVVLPDAFNISQRSLLVETCLKLAAQPQIIESLVTGEGFY